VIPVFHKTTPVFLVSDIVATVDWYRRHLGFDADPFPPTPPHAFAILRKDDVEIFLQQLPGYQRPDVYRERPGGVWSAYLHVSGVRALFDQLRVRSDVAIVQPLRLQPYGQNEFEVRDPNGYVLVFAEKP
jgi:uncharacterized glyoxalase superfamily protein PhnB